MGRMPRVLRVVGETLRQAPTIQSKKGNVESALYFLVSLLFFVIVTRSYGQ